MRSSYIKKLDAAINDLTYFLEKEYSSRFKDLSIKEDRQLFFLANILARLKLIAGEIKEEEKILIFSRLKAQEKELQSIT